MKEQKYRTKKGRGRLSRNRYNLGISYNSLTTQIEKQPLKVDVATIGSAYIDKSIKGGDHTTLITKEYKDQFTAHQIVKSYYGSINKTQLSNSLINIEERLDVLLYRTGRPKSIFEARFWIRKGFISVNGSINRNVYSHINIGSVINIKHPILSSLGLVGSHLCVKQAGSNLSIAIYKKPLLLNNIRYPKGLNIDKFLLVNSL